jgi:hypothetical protein
MSCTSPITRAPCHSHLPPQPTDHPSRRRPRPQWLHCHRRGKRSQSFHDRPPRRRPAVHLYPNPLHPPRAALCRGPTRCPNASQTDSKGHRPIILVGYNESQTAVAFELTFHPPVTVRVFVPKDSWNRGTCGPENVRAAIQKAYLNTLRGDEQPVIVKPTMVSLNLTPLRSLPPTRYVPAFGV